MRILLPPSEGKTDGGRGRPLRGRAPHPLLHDPRTEVLAALQKLLGADRDEIAARLLLPPATVDAAIAADTAVLDAPTTPALQRYAGVVYDGLDAGAFTASERRVADRGIVVMSGLFGAVRGDEAVPTYRVPAKADLPGVGVVGTFWRRRLDTAMPQLLAPARGESSDLVVDLRSSDYAAMWRPRGPAAAPVVEVVVHSPLPRGGWGVVSFASKHAKGRLAAALVRRAAAGAPVAEVDDLAAAWADAGGLDLQLLATAATAPRRVLLRTATSRAPGAV